MSWVGEDQATLFPKLYTDVDFASCTRTSRSTSGVALFMMDKFNSFLAKGADSSLEQTQAVLEDLLRDEDIKIFKQLDDLKLENIAKNLIKNKSKPFKRR